jgi:hypothetical protein
MVVAVVFVGGVVDAGAAAPGGGSSGWKPGRRPRKTVRRLLYVVGFWLCSVWVPFRRCRGGGNGGSATVARSGLAGLDVEAAASRAGVTAVVCGQTTGVAWATGCLGRAASWLACKRGMSGRRPRAAWFGSGVVLLAVWAAVAWPAELDRWWWWCAVRQLVLASVVSL